MFNKLISLIITRIIEFTVVVLVVRFLCEAADNPNIRVGLVMAIVVLYCVYLGVTVSNDYKELKYGEGEPME